MSDYPSRQEVAQALADAFGLRRIPATIVDYDSQRAGHVIVMQEGSGGISLRMSVPNKAVVPISPGMPVLLGRDHLRRLVVKEADDVAQVAAGVNPMVNNPADRNFYATTNQDNLATLACTALGTAANPSTEIVVYPWMWRSTDGVWYELPAQRFDMTNPAGDGSIPTLIPSTANQHRLIAIWVTDSNTVTYTASTAKAVNDDIDITDVQECEDAADATWSPVRFWRVYTGMTNITESDSWRDARQLLNIGRGSTGGGGGGGSDLDARYMAMVYGD